MTVNCRKAVWVLPGIGRDSLLAEQRLFDLDAFMGRNFAKPGGLSNMPESRLRAFSYSP